MKSKLTLFSMVLIGRTSGITLCLYADSRLSEKGLGFNVKNQVNIQFIRFNPHELSIERRGVKHTRFMIKQSGFKPWPGYGMTCSYARQFTLKVPLSTQGYKYWSAVLSTAGYNFALEQHLIL